MCKFFILN